MKVFVGFGYNERDKWIIGDVFPILHCMGFVVVTGEEMHGQELSPEVKRRIEQSDVVVGFLTIRDEQDKYLADSKFTPMSDIRQTSNGDMRDTNVASPQVLSSRTQ